MRFHATPDFVKVLINPCISHTPLDPFVNIANPIKTMYEPDYKLFSNLEIIFCGCLITAVSFTFSHSVPSSSVSPAFIRDNQR